MRMKTSISMPQYLHKIIKSVYAKLGFSSMSEMVKCAILEYLVRRGVRGEVEEYYYKYCNHHNNCFGS